MIYKYGLIFDFLDPYPKIMHFKIHLSIEYAWFNINIFFILTHNFKTQI